MTAPHPDRDKEGTGWRLFYGRSPGRLLGPWIACTVLAAGIYLFETTWPVFHDVVKILYFILLVIVAIATGRWFRTRGGKRRQGDRRQGDRREPRKENKERPHS